MSAIPSLCSLWDRRLNELSWGERRLVALAGTIASDKPVLLLDEPYSGLHPTLSAQVTEVLNRVSEAHVVVLAEHDLQLVEFLADRAEVWVFGGGTVAASFAPGEFSRESILQFFDGA